MTVDAPEYLRSRADYTAAPAGTVVEDGRHGATLTKLTTGTGPRQPLPGALFCIRRRSSVGVHR